jgi:hypothetical protein
MQDIVVVSCLYWCCLYLYVFLNTSYTNSFYRLDANIVVSTLSCVRLSLMHGNFSVPTSSYKSFDVVFDQNVYILLNRLTNHHAKQVKED